MDVPASEALETSLFVSRRAGSFDATQSARRALRRELRLPGREARLGNVPASADDPRGLHSQLQRSFSKCCSRLDDAIGVSSVLLLQPVGMPESKPLAI